MKLIDPKQPQMVNLNGKEIDASFSGLVTADNQPIKPTKGNKLQENKIKQQDIIRANKDAKINQWVEEMILQYLPEKQTSKVKSAAMAEKLLDKNRINVITHKTDGCDFCCIVQGQLLKPPKLIASMAWN